MKTLGWVGATLGGIIGGWLGSRTGIFGSFMFSIVGSGIGLYFGRRIGDALIS